MPIWYSEIEAIGTFRNLSFFNERWKLSSMRLPSNSTNPFIRASLRGHFYLEDPARSG